MADDLTADEKQALDEEARLKVAAMQNAWSRQIRSYKTRSQILSGSKDLNVRKRYEFSAYIAALDRAAQRLSEISEPPQSSVTDLHDGPTSDA
ncbi:hypothetical protein [Methylobacterium sp. D48H]